jgi:hypothetical protein
MVRGSVIDDECFSLTVHPHKFLEEGNGGDFFSFCVVAKVGQE